MMPRCGAVHPTLGATCTKVPDHANRPFRGKKLRGSPVHQAYHGNALYLWSDPYRVDVEPS